MNQQPLVTECTVHLDRYSKSIVATKPNKGQNREASIRKTWYNRKTPRGVKKVRQLLNLLYETKLSRRRLYWVTITTCQHKSGLTDKDLFYSFKLWNQHRAGRYVLVTERQRDTGDLHFHLVTEQDGDYDIPREVKRLGEVLKTEMHPALFEVERIKSIKALQYYITKYVSKPIPRDEGEFWQQIEDRDYLVRTGAINKRTGKPYKPLIPYSSLFECRTFSYSNKRDDYDLGEAYKRHAPGFLRAVNYTFLIEAHRRGLLEVKHEQEYFTVYKWHPALWALSKTFVSETVRDSISEGLKARHVCFMNG